MIVAELQVMTSSGALSTTIADHRIKFSDLASAENEYRRVLSLFERKENKFNDLPAIVEINGMAGNKVSVPLNDIRSVSLMDYDMSNRQWSGMKEAFPNLF